MKSLRLVSATVDGTLEDLAVLLLDEGITLGFDPSDAHKPVRGSWTNRPITEVMATVGDSLGGVQAVERSPGVWWVGKPGDHDMKTGVFLVPTDQAEAFGAALRVAGSTNSTMATVGDMVVIRDTASGLRDIQGTFDRIGSVRGQWLVEVRFIELTKRGAESLGMDWSVAGSVVVSGALAASGASAFGAATAVDLKGLLDASSSSSDVNLRSFSRLHVVEGETGELQVGESVPVPKRTVSNQGTVTTEGFETVNAGVLLKVTIRSVRGGSVRVSLAPEISDITGFVEGAPILARRRIASSCMMMPGGVVVLGGLSEASDKKTRSGGLPVLPVSIFGGVKSKEKLDRRLFIVVRVVEAGVGFEDAQPGPSNTPADPRSNTDHQVKQVSGAIK